MRDDFWCLDPSVEFLNHGSFGATPRPVQDAQDALRRRLEREPVAFFLREYEALLDEARAAIAAFVGAVAEDVVMVTNATAGVSAVVASWPLRAGDEILALDHGYPACLNALRAACARSGAQLRLCALPCPIAGPEEALAAVLAATTPSTRYCLLDAVTSPSAMVLPVDAIVAALRARGVETLVDAAHAPGMIPQDLNAIGAAWTTANLHKWLCAPKGAALLHVRRDVQDSLAPLVVSHGWSAPRADRPRLWQAFDWPGTFDPSAWLAVPAALAAVRVTDPEGWPQRMAANHAMALEMREVLCQVPGARPVAPPSMVGSMAAVLFAEAAFDGQRLERDLAAFVATQAGAPGAARPMGVHLLQEWLWRRHGIEVPVMVAPAGRGLVVRASAQRYNHLAQVERLAAALTAAQIGAAEPAPIPTRSSGLQS